MAAARAVLVSFSRRASAHDPKPFLIPRRGLAAGGDHHGPARVNIWDDPLSPSKWKEEHFVLASVAGWGLFGYGVSKLFSGKKENEDKKEEVGKEPVH